MTKTPNVEVVQRVNTALVLLRKDLSSAEAGKLLVQRYGVSGRQAYRYIVQAQRLRSPLPIPEQKVVFTVKLTLSLVHRLRRLAKSRRESLSGMITHVLELFLKRVENG